MGEQRRWVRTAWRAVGALTVVVALGSGAQQAVVAVAREERTVDRTVDGAPLSGVEVRTEVGRIEVVGTDEPDVRISGRVVDGLGPTELDQEVVDGVLVLRVRCTTPLGSPWCRADLRLEVPARFGVTVSSVESGVEVRGVDGTVRAASQQASVLVDEARGAVRARSSGGAVAVRGGGPGPIDARSWAGDVDVELAVPGTRVVARSTGGPVTVVVPRDDAYAVVADSSVDTLRVEVRTDPASRRSIEASSGAGAVTVRYAR